jgi:putative transposase
MEIILSHQIKLNPNKVQAEYFAKACGIARFTWNWGLAEWKKQYEAGLKPSGLGLKKEFNAIKKESFPLGI